MTSNHKKKRISDKTLGILLSIIERITMLEVFKILVLMWDHICLYQKAKIINKDLMMTLF